MSKEKFKLLVLIPLGIGLIVLIASSVTGLYFQLQQQTDQDVQEAVGDVEGMFHDELDEDALLISGFIDFISEDSSLQDAWQAKDRERLLAISSPIFENIRSQYRVTHFYFHGMDRVNFLRVHNPPRYGDYIYRHTMTGAAEKGEVVYGIELGPFGTFTLRVVAPWIISGEQVGYIELGEEVEHITPRVSSPLNAELIFVIDKVNLDQVKWEEGQRMMVRSGDWNLFDHFVVINQTMEGLLTPIQKYLNVSHEEHTDLRFDFELNGRNYRGGCVALFDAGGNEVGDIIVLCDITDALAAVRVISFALAAGGLLVGGILFVFFWILLGRIERRLAKAYSELQGKIVDIQQAKQQVQENEKALQEEVAIRKEAEIALENQVDELRKAREAALNIMADLESVNTERMQAEEALRESEEQYRMLVDGQGEGIAVADVNEKFTFVNPAAEKIFGVSPGTLVGRNLKEFLSPEDIIKIEGQTEKRKKKSKDTYGITVIRPDGEVRNLQITAAPQFGDDGEYIGSFGIFRDITDQKREEQLRLALYRIAEVANSEVKLDDLYATIHEIIGERMYAKNFYIALYDEKEDLISIPYFADEADTYEGPYKAGKGLTEYVIRTGETLLIDEAEHQELVKMGVLDVVGTPSQIWLGVPLKSNIGTFGAMVVQHYSDEKAYGEQEQQLLSFVSDQVAVAIERKRAEEELRNSEASLAEAQRIANFGNWEWNIPTNELHWSDEIYRIFGLKPQEFGATYEAFMNAVHPDDREFVTKSVEDALYKGESYSIDHRIVQPNGDIRIVHEHAEVAFNEAGKPIRMVGAIQDITDRKKAEEQIAIFRQFVETSGQGFAMATLEGKITYANPTLLHILGEENPEGVYGKTFISYYPEELRLHLQEEILPAVMKKGQWVGELTLLSTTGKIIPTIENIFIINDENGKPLCLANVVTDISTQKESEKEREQLLHDMGERVKEIKCMYGVSTSIRERETLEEIFQDIAVLIPPGWHYPEITRGKVVFDGKEYTSKPFEETPWRQTSDIVVNGDLRGAVEVYYLEECPILDEGPFLKEERCLIDGVARALSEGIERAQAEKALKEARKMAEREARKLRSMIEGMEEGIVVADANDIITEVNPWLLKKVGMEREGIIGKKMWDFHPDTEGTAKAKEVIEKFRNGKLSETHIVDREFLDMYVSMRSQPIYEGDEYRGAILNIIDITDLVTASRKVEETNQELIHAIEQARHATDLANQMAMEAADANESKSMFLANMSHEIRTPMNGIVGMTDLALDTELTAEQREYLGLVKSSAYALMSLLNDILDFSKIEAGKLDLEPINFSLRDCVGDTAQTLALRACEKGLELISHVVLEVPDALVGDPGRLRQIIVNLVGNALKFTEEGEIEIKVDVESEEKDNVMLHFSVRDTGLGIPRDKQSHIFESFTQVDGSTTRKFGGTGLGLTISKQLSEMMGGRIWMESEEEEGSTFHFTALFDLQKQPVKKAKPAQVVDVRGLSVLVVDDNATNRRVFEEMLNSWQIKPVLADEGKSALEVLEQAKADNKQFDLILTDAKMPGMNGYTLAKKIRKIPEYKDIKIIILTSAGRRGDGELCKELGVNAYLTKPIKQSDLYDAIISVFGMLKEEEIKTPLVTRHTLREKRRQLHVLLAEDNAVNQKLAVRILEKHGHSVVVAGDGEQAVKVYRKEKFDIILMDVQMPQMDGIEATGIIREDEKKSGKHIPIIALTAHAMKGDRERCLKAGMDGYAIKPIKTKELFSLIEHLLEGSEKNEEEASEETPVEGVIDTAAVMDRVDGDRELLADIVGLFLEDSPNLISQIQEAIANQDRKLLERSAHTLKGSAANFAAEAARQAAFELEQIGREGNLADAEDAFDKLKQEMERLQPALKSLITSE